MMHWLQFRSVLAATIVGVLAWVPARTGFTQRTEKVSAPSGWLARLSANGRFVLYAELPEGPEGQPGDLWLHDLESGASERPFDPSAQLGEISADGRFVALSSLEDLTSEPTDPGFDVFVYDTQERTYELVSANDAGEPGNAWSFSPGGISADGRFVAFISSASNLVPGDPGDAGGQVFVRDRQLKVTKKVSVSEAGSYAFSNPRELAISANGRYVGFLADASHPVLGELRRQIFVRDRVSEITQPASVNDAGVFADAPVREFSLSRDGRSVAFDSEASNLVEGDANFSADAFVRDLERGVTELVSLNSAGEQAEFFSDFEFEGAPVLSADGRFVAFTSSAPNLVGGDTNDHPDVFVRDRWARTTERISVSTAGVQGNLSSFVRGISDDGRVVAFASASSTLVDGASTPGRDVYVRYRVIEDDRDGDGIDEAADNCPSLANPRQEDADGNGLGDACVPLGSLDRGVRIGTDPIIGAGSRIARGAQIGDGARIGARVSVDRDVVAGSAVTIGERSRLEREVRLGSNVRLGARVTVGRGARIGSNTVVEDGVRIGRNSVIEGGARIRAAVAIGEGVAIGTRTEVGARASLGRATILGADNGVGEAVSIARSVVTGARVHILENASIGRRTSIGDDASVGAAAVLGDSVTVSPGAVVPGGARVPSGAVVLP